MSADHLALIKCRKCKVSVYFCFTITIVCIQEMLSDPHPSARVTAVLGVCRVCVTYWDLIPMEVVKKLIAEIVTELAWDASSVEVRMAVVQVGR